MVTTLDIKGIIKFVVIVGAILSVLFLIPIITGLIYKEDIKDFAIYDSLLFAINGFLWLILRNHKIAMKVKGSIIAVNIVWILLGVSAAIPYMMYTHIDFSSAFFESISGYTTTGATVYSNIEGLPHHILMLRSLTHWIGGMGIIVLGVGLLSIINPTGSLSMFKAESTGISVDKIAPKIKDTALMLWAIYAGLTLLDTFFLHMFGMNWFDAINHAFSTISTGGFSTKNSSMWAFVSSSGIIWTTTIFMVLSAINFLAHLKFLKGDLSGYFSEEVKVFVIIFFILSFALSVAHYYTSNDSFELSMEHSFFTISSIISTTGFATVDYDKWPHIATIIIFIAMFIGGTTGSTAGGAKVIRYIIIFKNIINEMKRIIHSNAILSVFVDNKKLKDSLVNLVLGFFTLYAFTILLVMLYLYARGFDEMTSFSAAIATTGNIGPGFAGVGPSQNYGFFSWYDKWILSFAMIIGRLECYTFYLLFTTSFWKKF